MSKHLREVCAAIEALGASVVRVVVRQRRHIEVHVVGPAGQAGIIRVHHGSMVKSRVEARTRAQTRAILRGQRA